MICPARAVIACLVGLLCCEGVLGQENEPVLEPITLELAPLNLRSPEKYHANLHLDPVREVRVSPVADGVVETIPVKLGESVMAAAEVARLDARAQQIGLRRAQAKAKAAKLAVDAAAAGPEKQIASAHEEAANEAVKLAQYHLDQTRLTAPFSGTVVDVPVVAGQLVKAGDPVVALIDPSRLVVNVPVDRTQVTQDAELTLNIEEGVATGRVKAILPLAERFDSLRELIPSAATAVVEIDNSSGRWQVGQTVYSDLIPRNPVVEVPNEVVSSNSEGERQVMVVRGGIVREIPIQLLGAVGPERTFVAGPFAQGDELVLESSIDLEDGTQVIPQSISVTPKEEKSKDAAPSQRSPVTPSPSSQTF